MGIKVVPCFIILVIVSVALNGRCYNGNPYCYLISNDFGDKIVVFMKINVHQELFDKLC